MKKLIKITIIVSLIVLLINLILGNDHTSIKYLHYYLIYSMTFAAGNYAYFYLIGKYLSWEKHPQRTLIISILGSIPVNAGIYFILNWFFKVVINKQDFSVLIVQFNLIEYLVVVMFALIISLIIMIGYFFKEIEDAKLKAEQLKTQNERMRFESLKAQLDPHFLFNNLNVLASLIGENPEKAENFTLALSDIYQYILSQKNKKLVPVKDEIKFAQKYLDLLKMRFEDGLNYTLPDMIPEGKIPPLSLQLLLENAVKHNTIYVQKPLKINVSFQNNKLIVTNNLNPKQNKDESYKIGLKSLKERYKLLNSQIEIIQNQNSFTVKLPIIK